MNRLSDPTFDQRVADWLEADPILAPREVLDTVLAAYPSITQRPALRRPWRFPSMTRVALPAAAALVVVLGGALLLPRLLTPPSGDQSPSPARPTTTAPSTAPTLLPTVPPVTPEPPRPAGFTPAGSMADPRAEHFAVLLTDGSVLVGGGMGPIFPDSRTNREYWNTTERWSPDLKNFAASAELTTTNPPTVQDLQRLGQHAFALPDGRALIVPAGCGCNPAPQLHAELWSLVDGLGQVTSVQSLELVRVGHTATMLADGRILIAGGSTNPFKNGSTGLAEVWDPIAGTITPTGSMHVARAGHVATLLPDGRVLVIGGMDLAEFSSVTRAEVWDPATAAFTFVPSLDGIAWKRDDGGETLHLTTLPDGRVLIIDGTRARTWDPASGALADAGALLEPRLDFGVALLPDGQVLVVGGKVGTTVLGTSELWDPGTNGFSSAGTMLTARSKPTATTLANGRVLVVGGYGSGTNPEIPERLDVLASAELWDTGRP
jgi:hypothetical protein